MAEVEDNIIGKEVLSFYQELPFNNRSSIDAAVDQVRKSNSLAAYPDLMARIARQPVSVIEFGCGVGHLSNSIAYHHASDVTAIDFNPVAVDRAQAVARKLEVGARFELADIFRYQPRRRFDIAISVGVLHHTGDPHGAIRRIADAALSDDGALYIGLYHLYGRRPFLEHFRKMAAAGDSEEAQMREFARLYGSSSRDETLIRSWYRDQVRHPHESQHTLCEICALLQEIGLQPLSTSINRFKPVDDWQALFNHEKTLAEAGERHLQAGRYFPGFFTVMAERRR